MCVCGLSSQRAFSTRYVSSTEVFKREICSSPALKMLSPFNVEVGLETPEKRTETREKKFL